MRFSVSCRIFKTNDTADIIRTKKGVNRNSSALKKNFLRFMVRTFPIIDLREQYGRKS